MIFHCKIDCSLSSHPQLLRNLVVDTSLMKRIQLHKVDDDFFGVEEVSQWIAAY